MSEISDRKDTKRVIRSGTVARENYVRLWPQLLVIVYIRQDIMSFESMYKLGLLSVVGFQVLVIS